MALTIEQAFQAALAHHQAGRLAEAEGIYRQILAQQPHHANALNRLGLIAMATGHYKEAFSYITDAITQCPSQAAYHSNLGEVHRHLGRTDEAVVCFERALSLRPNFPEALVNLRLALSSLGRFEEAVASCERALTLQPHLAEAHQNLGDALVGLGLLERAVACFQRAIALKPGLAEAHSNLGVASWKLGRYDEALASYRRALVLKPDWAITHWNLAVLLLLLGHHEEGWKEHEWRFGVPRPWRKFSEPRWDGGTAPGQTILLYPEQGHGDTIQFLRYVPLVRARADASRVLLICAKPLARLVEQTDGWNAEIVARESWDGPALPSFDRQLSMLSLPLALGLVEALPMERPYLRADLKLRATWRERLGAPAAFRVGIVWSGSPLHENDLRRSIPWERLIPLLSVPGVSFYNLQIEHGRGQPPAPADGLIDLTEHICDFADTAALMAALDLVISVDTATAHLAGALGRPVWTLLPFVPDWRWGLERENTAWYPTMRLFRQPSIGDWDSVIRRVAEELAAFRP